MSPEDNLIRPARVDEARLHRKESSLAHCLASFRGDSEGETAVQPTVK